ncbi:putative phospholipid-transporting ATPase VD [Portunus trituberculatus]|uniref:Putative phospholipid-transporting ATPase VD n=1 Tax=Portunus trituberculatus TaxID=210409 RepID=A0A5B7H0D5_PORTR|nr:putative phospholipid-transporting ATPase VD [Portunus trituberculatus]
MVCVIQQSQFEVNASQGLVPFLLPQATGAPLARARQLNSPVWVGFISFWTFIIIYQVIIPISLYVTIEVIKLMQVYHIHQDKDFEDKRSGKTIECRALNIPEELGQIEYVFTDKTGTLTENQMVFQCCSINDVDYSHTPIINTSSSSSSQVSLYT